jgi:hypothetical protein
MNSKVVLVLIAMVGTGIFALPQTMALFAGQHSFYNIDPTGNQVPCQKCHGDVQAELTGAVNPLTNTSPPHADMKCEFCHRLQIGRSAGDNIYALITYNDAVISNTGPGGQTVASKATEVRYAIVNPADYEAGTYPTTIADNEVMSGLAGSHGHSVANDLTNASNPAALKPGAVPCAYPECDLTNPGIMTFLFNASWNTVITPIKPSMISLSPTFDTKGKFIAAPAGKVLNSIGTTLCGGTLVDPNDPSKGFTNQVACPGAAGKVYPLVVGGVPLDTIPGTQMTGFLGGKVTWGTTGAWTSTPNFDYAGSRDSGTGSKYHAASLVACLDCHGGSSPSYAGHETTRLSEECNLCHYANEPGIGNQFRGINAGGFGMGLTNSATDNGSKEVHKAFVTSPDSIGVFGGRYAPASNDACIACHTHVAVSIQYTRPNTLVFAANEGSGWNTGNWAVSGFTTAGSTVTTPTSTYPVPPLGGEP